MAKTSMVQRERKRMKIVAKYAKKRAELKAQVKNLSLSPEERMVCAATNCVKPPCVAKFPVCARPAGKV
jgi:ribosomal protein S17